MWQSFTFQQSSTSNYLPSLIQNNEHILRKLCCKRTNEQDWISSSPINWVSNKDNFKLYCIEHFIEHCTVHSYSYSQNLERCFWIACVMGVLAWEEIWRFWEDFVLCPQLHCRLTLNDQYAWTDVMMFWWFNGVWFNAMMIWYWCWCFDIDRMFYDRWVQLTDRLDRRQLPYKYYETYIFFYEPLAIK